MKKWTKRCKCGYFIPDNYELCDSCLLNKFELTPIAVSEYEFMVRDDLFDRDDVIKALRKAMRGK